MGKIDVQGYEIAVVKVLKEDFISLTDIAKHRNPDAPADIVKNWMRTRSTIEFLGLWEHLNNPDFKFARARVSLAVMDLISGAKVGDASSQVRKGHINLKEAEYKAVQAVSKTAAEELMKQFGFEGLIE